MIKVCISFEIMQNDSEKNNLTLLFNFDKFTL